MITPGFVQTMARYNKWQNGSLYGAADTLTDDDRRKDRGAVFHSIHETMSHLLWGDQIWMSRFADMPAPMAPSVQASLSMIADWDVLKSEREEMDQAILEWSNSVASEFLNGELSWYSGSQKKDFVSNAGKLVMHMFNHQTHHRGQIHAMLTAAGCKPDDTDLFIME
ncbi:MAG: DinB family protein [Pseudomonadota bacterium]